MWITPTYAGCPAMATMRADLYTRLREAGFARVEVRTVLDPPWSTDWITAQGRRTRGWVVETRHNEGVSDQPRRPAYRDPSALENLRHERGPAELTEAAHSTAAALVSHGRATADPEVTARLVQLVEEHGLDTLAELWAERPARSLPGALWRLYALREWVRQDPTGASRDYTAGHDSAVVQHAVAGVAEPPGPQQVHAMADVVLTGVFDGDLAVALERAAAFCRVVAAGRANLAGEREESEPEQARQLTRWAASLQGTAEDLAAAGRLWRDARLV